MSDLLVNERLTIPDAELRVAFSRSSGPGGQNVNKVESKVELRWCPGESDVLSESDRARLLERLASRLTNEGDLIVTSSHTRDQIRNREDAEQKLAELVRTALHRPKRRRPTRPSRGARERRIQGKKRRGQVKRNRKPPTTE